MEDNSFFLSSPFQIKQNKRRRTEERGEENNNSSHQSTNNNNNNRKDNQKRNNHSKHQKRVKREEELNSKSFISNLKSGYQSFVDPLIHLAGETSNYLENLFSFSPRSKRGIEKRGESKRRKSIPKPQEENIEKEEGSFYYYPVNFLGMDSSFVYSFENFGLEEKEEKEKKPNVFEWFSRKKPLILNEKKEDEQELDQSQISFSSHLDSFQVDDKEREEKRKSLTIDLTSITEDEEEKVEKPAPSSWRRSVSLREKRRSLNQEEADQLNIIRKNEEIIKSCKEDRNRKGLSDRERLERRMRKRKAGVYKFTDDEKELLEDFFTISGRQTDVLSDKFNQKITRSDLSTLKGSNWLNDEIINFYMNILTQRNKEDPNLPKCEFFNTFFYPMLADKGYERVKKWTRKIDVFEKDKIIIPIHLGMHWCLAVVNIKEKRFEYYDSLGGGGTRGVVLKNLRKWLASEYLDKKKQQLNLDEWTDYKNSGMVPQQENGYDCGVFTCRFADCISQNKPLLFSQENMKHFRKRLMVDVLSSEYTIRG